MHELRRAGEWTVAASTLLASQRPLTEALDLVVAQGFEAVDLPLHQGWAHLDPSDLADDLRGHTARLVDLLGERGVRTVALNAGAGAEGAEEERRVDALIALAQDLGATVITLPSGGQDRPVAEGVGRARRLVALAAGSGVRMTFETHRFTAWEDPRVVRQHLDEVEGLGVTLDASHFTTGPHQDLGLTGLIGPLLPEVAHVHLRAAGRDWSEIQLPAGDGTLDQAALLTTLADAGYAGALSVEYVDTIAGVDHVREAGRMRELVEGLGVRERTTT